jgi:hypothetical protein
MKTKFIKACYRLLFAIAVFFTLIVNLVILVNNDYLDKSGDHLINWTFFIGDDPLWQCIVNWVFGLSNLAFSLIAIDIVGKHLFEHWGKRKNQMGWYD